MKLNTDRIVSLTAMLVGLGSLFLAGLLRLVEIADAPRAWVANVGGLGGEKAVIEVDYSSVYGDRWRITSDNIVPAPR